MKDKFYICIKSFIYDRKAKNRKESKKIPKI